MCQIEYSVSSEKIQAISPESLVRQDRTNEPHSSLVRTEPKGTCTLYYKAILPQFCTFRALIYSKPSFALSPEKCYMAKSLTFWNT